MFTITPIGSCRINTPLRRAAENGPFKRNLDRIYGFCHSSAEAVQQVKFLLGDDLPDPALEPFLSPGQPLKELLKTPHTPSDLYIIELSSAKQITIGESCVQLNYLTQNFKPFFSDRPNAAAFWKCARVGEQNGIDRFLQTSLDDQVIDKQAFSILRQIRYCLTSPEALENDISYLLETLPSVLFESHVNAIKPDGYPIASREKYIEQVASTVKSLGGNIYNPTDDMRRLGQHNAIEDSSTSLAHFTDAFSKIVFDSWHRGFISPQIDSLARAKPTKNNLEELAADIEYQIDEGGMTEAKRRINKALEANGPVPILVALKARCLLKTKGREEAIHTLKASLKTNPEDAALWAMLLETYIDQSKVKDAHECWNKLASLAANISGAQTLRLAHLLEAEGNLQDALCLSQNALASPQKPPEALETVARMSLALQDAPQIEACTQCLKDDPFSIEPKTATLLLLHAAPPELPAYLQSLGQKNPSGFMVALETLQAMGHENRLAEAIKNQSAQDPAFVNVRLVSAVLERWEAALDGDISVGEKLVILARIQKVSPRNGKARIMGRELRKQALSALRRSIKANNIAAVETLQNEITAGNQPITEGAIFLSRHYFKTGNHTKSLAFSQEALAITPENPVCLLLAMRTAFKLENYLLVDDYSRRIMARNRKAGETTLHEVLIRQERLPALCLQASRKEADPFKAWQLGAIACNNNALTDKAEKQLDKLKRQIGNRAREMQKQNHPDYIAFTQEAAELIPDFDILLQSLGRYYVGQKKFEKALPYWAQLSQLHPEDESALFQLRRCHERLPHPERHA